MPMSATVTAGDSSIFITYANIGIGRGRPTPWAFSTRECPRVLVIQESSGYTYRNFVEITTGKSA
jgi:hypothetical protein